MGSAVTAVQVIGNHETYKQALFTIDGEQFPAPLCSLAIAKKTGGKALFIVPESIATVFAQTPEECMRMLQNTDLIEEKIRNKLRAGDVEFEIQIFPSTGTWQGKTVTAEFKGGFENIEAAFFLLFIDLIKQGRQIYFDVSSGLNVYPAAGIRALYNAATHQILTNFDQHIKKTKTAPQHHLVFYPQVNKENQEIKPTIQPVEAKILKDFPLPREEIEKISRTLYNYINRHSNQAQSIVMEGFRAFNCLTLNTPLPLFFNDIIRFIEETEISQIENELQTAVSRAATEPESPPEGDSIVRVMRKPLKDFRYLRNVLGALALTKALMRLIKEFRNTVTETGVSLAKLEEFFLQNIYRDGGVDGWFTLNKELLTNEIKTIQQKAQGLPRNQPQMLTTISGLGGSGDHRRNFFAHSGFLADITQVTKDDNDNLHLKYSFRTSSVRCETIRKWISLMP
ncbi:MAG: hypothetical protein N3H84_06335 [Candidatus Caldarchaeum sp.]|nr:hypothetical protein [Candidatus Caldarchaeum sp.]MCX8201704.1 hypothetical protein [Candidatus Caldarchaeum sp.]MDW8435410.1 TM1812 family CRISPR-associated protein [Candidatus Caldarchaeum sp.]